MIQLHNLTKFSVGDALPSSSDYCDVMKRGDVLSITDHMSLGGMVQHQKACDKAGIKPVFGVDANGLTYLAKNWDGMLELFLFLSSGRAPTKNVICMSGDLSGDIALGILRGDRDNVFKRVEELKEIHGDDFYLEDVIWNLRESRKVRAGLQWLGKRYGVGVARTCASHYIKESEYFAHSVLMADAMSEKVDDYHLPRIAHFQEIEEDDVLREISDKCNASVRLDRVFMPKFSDTEDEDLLSMIDGSERSLWEYEIIKSLGFCGYFLIVADFCNYARRNDIPVGPGRGSGGGSNVAYNLGITTIDPIKYDLPFERFLNPDRVSLPDFDIDFGNARRGEVIEYIERRYGKEYVGHIGTVTGLKPRAAYKVVARVTRVPYKDSERISAMLPDSLESSDMVAEPKTLTSILNVDGRPVDDDYLHIKEGFRELAIARVLEGAYKSSSLHAAGIIISPVPLSQVVPTHTIDGVVSTQVPFKDAEALGLVKFDFLGLKELDVLHALGLHNVELDHDDPAVYELLASGMTEGIFQMSGVGISRFLKQLKPKRFDDIVAATSLFRPGPKDAGMHLVYARRANGEEPVEYIHPAIEEVLGDTYGVIVFQEQVMQLARRFAGYTLAGADTLRRVIGKKQFDKMKEHKDRFISKAGEEIGEDSARQLWDQIETFARYGFNKAHAVAYSEITFRTAWAKTHMTAQLLAAQCNVRSDDVNPFVKDMPRFGIVFGEVDVRYSQREFRADSGSSVRAGLNCINGIAAAHFTPVNDIHDLFDMPINKSTWRALLEAGACDELIGGMDMRCSYLESYDKFKSRSQSINSNQFDLFGGPPKIKVSIDEVWSDEERLSREYSRLGRYVTGHPTTLKSGRYKMSDLQEGDEELVWCIVRRINTWKTMAFIDVEDSTGDYSLTCFDYEPGRWREDEMYCFLVKAGEYNGELSYITG